MSKRLLFMVASVAVLGMAVFLIQALSQNEWKPRLKTESCAALPPANVVLDTINKSRDSLDRAFKLPPGAVVLDADLERCPGKGEVLIYHRTYDEAQRVKSVLGEKFFGLPYRLVNY